MLGSAPLDAARAHGERSRPRHRGTSEWGRPSRGTGRRTNTISDRQRGGQGPAGLAAAACGHPARQRMSPWRATRSGRVGGKSLRDKERGELPRDCQRSGQEIASCVDGSGVATDFRVGGGRDSEPNLEYPQILFSHRISATNFFNTALTP